jgi:hypothetical protein
MYNLTSPGHCGSFEIMIDPIQRPVRKKNVASVSFPITRNLKFIGYNKSDSIVVSNCGNATLIARGTFQLSGIIFSRQSTFEIDIDGKGAISFKGRCKNIIINNIIGECILDLSDVACRSVTCLSASGKSTIILGRTKVIKQLVIGNDTIVRYKGKPKLVNHLITENARFEEITVAA